MKKPIKYLLIIALIVILLITIYYLWSSEDFTKSLAIVKDLFLAVAALSTIIATWYGMNKWKTELVSKKSFELREELLFNLYKIRDYMSIIRSPWGRASDYPENYNIADEFDKQKNANLTKYKYNSRLKLISPFFQKLDDCMIAAELTWDREFNEHMLNLNRHFNKLTSAMETNIENILKDRRDPKIRKVIYSFDEKEDQYKIDLDKIISDIEQLVNKNSTIKYK